MLRDVTLMMSLTDSRAKFSDACVSRYFNVSKNQAAANSTSSLDTVNNSLCYRDHVRDQIVEDPLVLVHWVDLLNLHYDRSRGGI